MQVMLSIGFQLRGDQNLTHASIGNTYLFTISTIHTSSCEPLVFRKNLCKAIEADDVNFTDF